MFIIHPQTVNHPAYCSPTAKSKRSCKFRAQPSLSNSYRCKVSTGMSLGECIRAAQRDAKEEETFDKYILHQNRDVLITKENDKVTLQLDLPGVKLADVNVSLHHDVLSIDAHRKSTTNGEYSRKFSIDPLTTDTSSIRAHLSDGVLQVDLPKKAAPDAIDVPVEYSDRNTGSDSEKDLSIAVDLPGVKVDDIKIKFNGRAILLCANRVRGHFESSITRLYRLPLGKYDTNGLKASLCEGVLSITAPHLDDAESIQVIHVTGNVSEQAQAKEEFSTPLQDGNPTEFNEISVETVDDFDKVANQHEERNRNTDDKEWEHVLEEN